MKVRVKATGEILEIFNWSKVDAEDFQEYELSELEIIDPYSMDYWTRLEHQYAGMAMHGILSNLCIADEIDKEGIVTKPLFIAEMATAFAHALIQKLKEKEERK